MPPLNLPTLAAGARVHHELRVVERDTRKTRHGDPFVILTLGNCSGEIRTAPIWSDKLHWVDGAERGTIAQVIGEVKTYSEGESRKRQLEVTGPVRLISAEAVRLEEFLPRVEDDVEALWSRLDRWRGEIESTALRRAIGLFFDDESFRLAFERAPGSVRGHHAKIGGLLRHVLEVAYIGRSVAQVMRSAGSRPADADLVIAGALLHDVGKVEAYRVSVQGFEYTTPGHLLGHVALGSVMLERRLAACADPVCSDSQLTELHHMILSHHGSLEFGSPVRPMTLEAEILHWADECSAKASSMGECYGDGESFAGGGEFSERLWMLDRRRIWQKPHSWE